MSADRKNCDIPLFVDLDGTLLRGDLAQELLVRALASPAHLGQTLGCLTKGRATLKHALVQGPDFDVTTLPYNDAVLAYLVAERAKGRTVILATATHEIAAQRIADHLGLFDDVIASTKERNLKGVTKLAAIHDKAQGPFEYIGDAKADGPIWQAAEVVGFVNPPVGAKSSAGNPAQVSLDIADRPSMAGAALHAMRPHQWAKNLLVFLPLFFSHGYADAGLVLQALITFALFSLLASAIYIINDLLGLEADRVHPRKRHRPFAAGHLRASQGMLLSVILILGSLGTSLWFLGGVMSSIFMLYLVMTTLYSTWLKHYSTIDVITLTCLYTLRIFAGGVAVGATPSPWLLNFSLFFFLSLALMKRYVELVRVQQADKERSRGYWVSDLPALLPMGIASGALAVLTLTLYLNSDYVAQTYASPEILWLIAPLILFWIYRAWIWALRDKIDDDPVVFALRDRISRTTLVLTCVIVIGAKFISLPL